MNRIIKSLTLVLFTGLVICFVLYRSGIAARAFQGSHNGGYTKVVPADSLNDTAVVLMLDSSMISSLKADSPFVAPVINSNTYMGSSKSLMIIEPIDFSKIKFDTVKQDTSKIKFK